MADNFKELMKAIAVRCPGGRIPDTYLVIDLETTGLPDRSGREEYVTQFGYAVVQDRKITDNYATLLKTPPGWINPEAASVTGITDEMIQKDGREPAEFYHQLISIFELFRNSDALFVGHNVAKFDGPFLEADFAHHGLGFRFKQDEFIDTGMMFKASQLFASPADAESLGAFFHRVSKIRSRAKWKLTYAMTQLGLDMKYGIDLSAAHDAGFDCKMTHLLLEDLRQRAGLA
jgi:DNA polymerase III epsilon subunit-like protein